MQRRGQVCIPNRQLTDNNSSHGKQPPFVGVGVVPPRLAASRTMPTPPNGEQRWKRLRYPQNRARPNTPPHFVACGLSTGFSQQPKSSVTSLTNRCEPTTLTGCQHELNVNQLSSAWLATVVTVVDNSPTSGAKRFPLRPSLLAGTSAWCASRPPHVHSPPAYSAPPF